MELRALKSALRSGCGPASHRPANKNTAPRGVRLPRLNHTPTQTVNGNLSALPFAICYLQLAIGYPQLPTHSADSVLSPRPHSPALPIYQTTPLPDSCPDRHQSLRGRVF